MILCDVKEKWHFHSNIFIRQKYNDENKLIPCKSDTPLPKAIHKFTLDIVFVA